MRSLNLSRDSFFALDLDRTLLNTNLVFTIFQRVLEEMGYSNGVEKARRELEVSGGSFDILEYMTSLLSIQQLQAVTVLFRDQARKEQLLNEGAAEFLDFLKAHHIEFGILTYGSEKWQQEKLYVAGLNDLPALIIPDKGKGKLITHWYDENKASFKVPSIFGARSYAQLVMIDDKVSELIDLPSHAIGLLYRPTDNVLPSQRGEIRTQNIHIIRSFKEVITNIDDPI